MPCLVGNRFRLLELADQRVLFGARFQRRQRRRMQAAGEQRKISFCRECQHRKHIFVECAAEHEIKRDRHGDRRGRRQRCDRKIGRQHARYRDHQQHQEHHECVRRWIECRVDQDRRPAQAVEQVEQDEPGLPLAGCGG